MSDENDVIYGAHPVEEALKNPKRKFVKLTCTLNGAERLKAFTQPLGITPEIVNPEGAGPEGLSRMRCIRG